MLFFFFLIYKKIKKYFLIKYFSLGSNIYYNIIILEKKRYNMNKEKFCYYINSIKELADKEDNFCRSLEELDEENYCCCLLYSKPINDIISLLKIITGDTDMIDYFCWEIDFGESYTDGCVTDEEGNTIDISTPEKLYDYIVSNKNN